MARFCVRDGITHVVATPHCHRVTRLLRPEILPRVVLLNEELSHAGVPLTVLPGSEVQVVDAAAYRSDFEAGLYCHLGDGRTFTLLEFPWRKEQYPADAPQLVSWLHRQGMTPVVAHPERQSFFERSPNRRSQSTALADPKGQMEAFQQFVHNERELTEFLRAKVEEDEKFLS